MNYRIVVDSSANRLTDGHLISVPLKIVTDERQYVDDETLPLDEMLEYLSNYKGKSGTSCPNTAEYVEAFGDADWVFAITITSNLSGSYNAARIACEEYEETNPGKRAYVFDSLSAGPELVLLVEKIEEYMAQGMDFDQIVSAVEKYKEDAHLIFALESLTNLANNGRVSKVVAAGANILGIRIIGKAVVGRLDPTHKVRGQKKAVKTSYAIMKETGYSGGKVIIDSCYGLETSEQLAALIREEYPEANIRYGKCGALCSFYAEKGGLMIAFEAHGVNDKVR
jgi:DegV family protein with EDD domain